MSQANAPVLLSETGSPISTADQTEATGSPSRELDLLEIQAEIEAAAAVGDKSKAEYFYAMAEEQAMKAGVSPRGALPHISGLLDERRIMYSIPDQIFAIEPSFDRILVYQIPREDPRFYGGSRIIAAPQQAQQRHVEEVPRGILVGAGLNALDSLVSHGIKLGDMVTFVQQAPWRLPAGYINGVEVRRPVVLRCGDIIASEDLPKRRKAGKVVNALFQTADGRVQHRLSDPTNEKNNLVPHEVWIPEDY